MMDEKILGVDQIFRFLNISSPKTLRKLIREDNLPVSVVAGQYRAMQSDLINWFRAKYPDHFKNIMRQMPMSTRTVKVRGSCDGEEYGIVERPDGTRHTVEGAQYLKFLAAVNDGFVVGQERLIKKMFRSSVSFQQTITEPTVV